MSDITFRGSNPIGFSKYGFQNSIIVGSGEHFLQMNSKFTGLQRLAVDTERSLRVIADFAVELDVGEPELLGVLRKKLVEAVDDRLGFSAVVIPGFFVEPFEIVRRRQASIFIEATFESPSVEAHRRSGAIFAEKVIGR